MGVSSRVVELCKSKGHKVVTYGATGDIRIVSSRFNHGMTEVEFEMDRKIYNVRLNVIGEFQVHNIICAFALAINTGFDKEDCLKVLEKLHPVPGRMEIVLDNVLVDYAHTDDALKKAMQSIRSVMRSGRMIVVFGCGGDRDKTKRKLMGQVVSEMADIAIVTDDNPRTEDPSSIRAEIMKYCTKGVEIEGRENAIKKAIELKQKDDFILIAGKGHEKYQIIGTTKYSFDDVAVAKNCLSI
jgi:UDP-N-acetylmuramoyl-L-alanyl-D-glutamate--2,6-diaminopimelate ligase